MIWQPFRRRTLFSVLFVCMITAACDESASLLDFEGLRTYLKLTPAQTEILSGQAQQILTEVEGYIRIVRQVRGDLGRERSSTDDRTVLASPEVEDARQRAVENIRRIAGTIRQELTPEQQERFDRMALPDLRQSPQELEFMMVQSRRSTFSALRVKPSTRVSRTGENLSFDEMKEQRTIVFGPGGFSSGLEQFPIFVTATLYDSALVNAENRQAPAEQDAGKAEQMQEMFTIRLVISTFLHESYTSPDRWVIIVEDQAENQYEPSDIVEKTETSAPEPSPMIPRGYMAEGEVPMARKARQIDVTFPYEDAGRQILGTRLLRLVLFDKKDASYRTQGEWVLQ